MRRFVSTLLLVGLLSFAPAVLAQEAKNTEAEAASDTPVIAPTQPRPQPRSLDELLVMVSAGFEVERAINRRRVEEFRLNKESQERLLSEALANLARQEDVGQRLEVRYNENELTIGTSQARMTERLGELGELFGVVRQVAGDLSAQTLDSLTNSDGAARNDLLDRLGRSTELPTTSDLEALWVELQREITKQGKVTRYKAMVVTIEGTKEEREIIRAGPFTAISGGNFLHWEPADQMLRELGRQPPSRHLDTVSDFENATGGYAKLALDPSRGGLLVMLIDTPSNTERVQQGGAIGYVILGLGFVAGLVGIWRWIAIAITTRHVIAQGKNDRVDLGNPLGRVLEIADLNADADTETLELKLEEVVLRESSKLENFLWLVKTVSVVSPLLGLLGTVTGMIQTFQAITLFGAGDPKMMAGGISQALVTTMLGLIVAIPLVLLSDTLANSTRKIIDILDEKSAGLIALRSERANVGD